MRVLVALVCLLGLLSAVPVAAEVTPEDLERARREMAEVRSTLQDMVVAYEAAVAEEARLTDRLHAAQEALAASEQRLEGIRDLVRRRAAELYIEGASPGLGLLLQAGSMSDLSARLGYLEEVGAADRQLVRELEVARRVRTEQVAQVTELTERQASAVADLSRQAEQLNAALEAADARYRALLDQYRREEEARRRAEEARRRAEEEARLAAAAATSTTVTTTAGAAPDETATTTTTTTTTTTAPPSSDGGSGYRCPVDGAVAFTDTWGAPRSGGRRHLGVDMMAARGTPVVAIEPGSVSLRSSSLGGITIYLYGTSGTRWYYAHLDGYAPGLASGGSVGRGQLIGYVGSTGNASYYAPHLHFEQHPGGGSAINPYPLVDSICR